MAARVSRRQVIAATSAASFLQALQQPVQQSPLEQLLAACPAPNRLQKSFLTFWREEVFTKDESRGGAVRKAPDWPMFVDLEDDLLTEPLQVWDKARRVMASWLACAFDVWLIAGGQDPRWPALMQSRQNRQIILAAGHLEEIAGSAWFLQERVRFIVEALEERNIRERWPDFPEFSWSFTQGRASNGGRINAVAQGKDQLRGPGATAIHMEEISRWTQAKESIESAKLVTQGGGHCYCLTTAKVGVFAADLVLDRVGENLWR